MAKTSSFGAVLLVVGALVGCGPTGDNKSAAPGVLPGGNPLGKTEGDKSPPFASAEASYQGKPLGEWLQLLRQGDPREREQAAQALGKIGPTAKGVMPALIEAVKTDTDAGVRNEVVDQLEKFGPAAKDAVPALIGALKDESEATRWDACEALLAIGAEAKQAVPALIEALQDPVGNVRRHAAEALLVIDTEAAKKAGVKDGKQPKQ